MSRLNAERRRRTYGAVAGVLGIAPAEVGPLLGERCRAVWIFEPRQAKNCNSGPSARALTRIVDAG